MNWGDAAYNEMIQMNQMIQMIKSLDCPKFLF